MINHFIVTHFNIPIYTEFQSVRNSKTDFIRDEEYLDYRFALFEKYNLASIGNQTFKDFKWIVLFHEDTPQKYKEKMKNYQQQVVQFCPYFLNDEESKNHLSYVKNIINNTIDTSKKVFVTRTDNDDAFHERYLEEIQRIASQQTYTGTYVINYSSGLVHLQSTKYTRRVEYPDNHFLTVISDAPDIITPYDYGHSEFSKKLDLCNVSDPKNPMWLEIVHDKNVTNRVMIQIFRGVVNSKIFEQFHVDIKWTPLGYCKIVCVSLIPTLHNAFKKFYKIIFSK